MRSLLGTESKRQREGGGRRESPKPGSLYKVQSWLNWGSKGGQIRRPFHPDYYFLGTNRWSRWEDALCRRFIYDQGRFWVASSAYGHGLDH